MGSFSGDGVRAALILVSLIWAGMLIGVSFVATPTKFAAPSLTLPVALDVGRQTFGVFNPIEIAAAVLLVGLASLGRRWILVSAALIAGIVALQAAWLLPVLDSRVETILAGGALPSSSLHLLYIALDVAKLLALLTLGGLLLFAGGAGRRQAGPRARPGHRPLSRAGAPSAHRTSESQP